MKLAVDAESLAGLWWSEDDPRDRVRDMELRPALLPPDDAGLGTRAEVVRSALERLPTESVSEVAAGLARELDLEISGADLGGWWGSMDPEEIAAMLVRPPAHILCRLRPTHDELVELVCRFTLSAGDIPEPDVAWYCDVFDANVPHPAGSALAFHPPNGEQDATPEQVVAWATSYRAIQL